MSTDKSAILARINKLRKEISDLRYRYHVADDPAVSDDVYDSLTRELMQLEKENPEFHDPNSILSRVAGRPLDKFKKVQHSVRLLSLGNVFSEEELFAWEKRNIKFFGSLAPKFEYFCELKFDGLAISLLYEDGKFVRGATRGDGEVGEDITENLKMVATVPLSLKAPYPKLLEVRGEALMKKSVWKKLNVQNEKKGLPLFANSRNAAAGSLRQLDPSLTRERELDFMAYEIAQIDESWKDKIKLHSLKHDLLKKFGFMTDSNTKKIKNLNEVYKFIQEIGKIRDSLLFGIDGVVVNIDSTEVYERLGVVGKDPRAVIAYKFPAERATTIVLDVTLNVGRTGVITPLAHFRPTLVAGSTVSKATLHNFDQIERLDLRIGDTVVIQKAGDVIPEVVEVLKKLRSGKEKKIKIPTKCPVCESEVEQLLGGPSTTLRTTDRSVAYYCVNKKCPAKNRRGMQHFVNVFEIYEVGPKILDRLKEEGLISDSADLFTLTEADLSGLERFGEKSAQNIVASIQERKKVLLWRFLFALGIMHVGEETAKDIANNFGNLKKIMNASASQINSIENIGPVVSKSVYDFFQEKTNLHFIEKLENNGVKIENAKKVENGKLTGKIFVLTGTMQALSRDEAKMRINSLGGKVASSVSKNTSFVVAGENSGSKLTEAKKLSVEVLDEANFLKMIS